MTKVLKEMAVAVASYEDRNTGQTKNRYKNIGVLMESENEDGSKNRFLLLDRSFNPAGVPAKPGSDKIMVSLFDPRERDGQSGQSNNQGGQSASHESAPPTGGVLDDDIPFAPVVLI